MAAPRWLRVVSALAAAVALAQLARVTVFMIDPSRTEFSLIPWSSWEVQHNCSTAYHVAATKVEDAANVYDPALYKAPLGPFTTDVYEYPPPFLLLARAVAFVAPDFPRARIVWFALDGALVLAALLAAARLLGREARTRAMLLSPLVLAAVPTLSSLQKANFQLAAVALAVLGMAAFERRRFATGGALLAFATVAKLFPGMLVLYLLAQRRWRAAGWTLGWCGAFAGFSLLDTGAAPWLAFLGHLPGLLGGEAFPAFKLPDAIAVNHSIPGLVFKVGLFGVPGMSFTIAKVVGWMYTVVAAAATVALARRPPAEPPLAWLAVLLLAALRSPFLPQTYAAFPPLWLLTLLAATRAWGPAPVVAGWLALNVYVVRGLSIDPRWMALGTLVPQATALVLAALVLRQGFGARPSAT